MGRGLNVGAMVAISLAVLFGAGWLAKIWDWGLLRWITLAFQNHWFLWIVLISLLACFLRKRVLNLPARILTIPYAAFLAYLFVFQIVLAKWVKAQPAFFLIWTFLFLLMFYLLFGHEKVWSLLNQRLEPLGRSKQYLGIALVHGLFFVAVLAWVDPYVIGAVATPLLKSYYLWAALLVLLSGLIRRQWFGKRIGYLKGLLVYFFAATLYAWLVRYYNHEWIFLFVTWYLAAWVHVFLEDILKAIVPVELETIESTQTKTPNKLSSALAAIPAVQWLGSKLTWLKPTAAWLLKTLKTAGTWTLSFLARRKKVLAGVIVGLILLVVGISVGFKVYDNYYVRILSLEPKGQVTDRVAIRITFSDGVRAKANAAPGINCFTIEPSLNGTYQQENERTIVFVPARPLQPSTQYKVVFKPETLEGVRKRLTLSARTEFNTEFFQVTAANLFYSVDPITGSEMEVIGQVDFNYPVSVPDLRNRTKVFLNDAELPFELEKSLMPTRFYLKGMPIKPQDKDQYVKMVINQELQCLGGTTPLNSDFIKELTLPSKPKLEVREVKLWHEPGTTFISILFNLPISTEQIEKNVTITPALTWKAETEYACAVLKGEFKPNTQYTIKVPKGLIAKTGEVLEQEHVESVYIQDVTPQVKFARKGHILSLNGPKTLAVNTINLDSAKVEIRKVFRSNLIRFLQYQEDESMTHMVYEGDIAVTEGKLNEEVTQYINLSKFQAEPYQGLFQIRLRDPNDYYNGDTAWFLCTDLGMIAKRSGADLWVYVVSVETHEPKAGATVELMSDNNQVMDRQTADGNGKVVFQNWQKHEYKLNPYYIVAKQGEDLSFLNFSWSELNQYQFSVGGDPNTGRSAQAFLTPERGVYRPGEKAYITGIVRNSDNTVPPDVPVELIVTDPQGTEYKRMTNRYNANGLVCFEVPFTGGALTGQYDLRLLQTGREENGREETLGSTTLKVEEFIPDKLKVEVKAPTTSQSASQPFKFTVKARQLFGPPAVGNKVNTLVRFYARVFSHPDYEGYVFDEPNRSFSDEEMDLGQDNLDEKGEKEYTIDIPRVRPPSALKAYIYTEVFDSGGREVSAAGYGDIDVYPYYVGLKVEGKAPYLKDKSVQVKIVAIDPKGKKQKVDKLRVVVKRKAWYSIFRHGSWGSSDYQSTFYEEIIDKKVMKLSGDSTIDFTPDKEGEYQIIALSPEGMQSSIIVQVLGTGYEVASLESPEKLKLVMDKKAYSVGDSAKVYIKAPFPGKLYLSVEREKVFSTQTITLSDLETTVNVPITEDYLPNMYVVALLVRKPTETKENLPMVSYGIEPLMVKNESKSIPLTWTVLPKVKSKDGIDVQLAVDSNPEKTHLVLAAVDEGILQITNFLTPNPLDFFYRKRSLDTQTYSIFDFLLPDLWKRKAAIGGGDGGDITRRHLNPIAAKKPKSLALFSGILSPDADGTVRYHFNTSDFNGEVRVMAMVVNADRYGSSAANVQVSDPIVLQLNTPRAVAPKDQFHIPVEIFNQTGKKADFTVKLSAEGPVQITNDKAPKAFSLEPGAQKRIVFFLTAKNDAGVAKFTVKAQGGGERNEKTAELAVRPIHTLKTTIKHGKLAPQGNVSIQVPAGFIPFGQRIRCNLSSNPLFQHLQSLEYLIAYPYGCAEQTTSQVFPLLYFKDLGLATGLFTGKANSIDLFVQAGIDRLEKQQLTDGEFSMWPSGGSGGRWITCYVSHFLLEAKAQGYRVSPEVLMRIKAYIKRASPHLEAEEPVGRLDRRNQREVRDENIDPYILYLKALIEDPDQESMAYLVQHRLDKLSEADRAILSMCYSQIGDKATAAKILKPDFKSAFIYREQYGDFNSSVRNTALYLAALTQAQPDSPKIQSVIHYLVGQMQEGRFATTQENAWAFIALGRAYGSQTRPVEAEILVNDAPYKKLSGQDPSISDNTLTGKKLTLKNLSDFPVYYYFLAEGTPLEAKSKPRSQGMKLTRAYRDTEGRSINLGNVAQGDLVIVTLDVQPTKDAVKNVVIVDLVPAGFEIENPRLQSRGQLGFDPAMSMNLAYQDIRDDRILLFCDEVSSANSFSYAVRAITPGRYVVPDALAEAMYDPAINALYGETATLNIADNNK